MAIVEIKEVHHLDESKASVKNFRKFASFNNKWSEVSKNIMKLSSTELLRKLTR